MNQAFKAKAAGKTVVLIDDELHTRTRLCRYLQASGLRVVEFSNAQAACEFLASDSAHVVITDLRLPEFTGLDLLRFVNQLGSPIPVILMSGIGNVSDVAQAMRLEAADYLIKPILDFDVVVQSIDRALDVLALKQENEAYKHRLERINHELQATVELLKRDQQAAKQVQHNLLPISPVEYGGLTLSHRIVPSLYLSGDFIDYIYVDERYVAYYLTDVSGHGASSAFVTVWLKQLVRRLFREKQLTINPQSFGDVPPALLELINKELMQSRFFSHLTGVVGVIDTQEHIMSYSIAGHLPLPVMMTPAGHVEFLSGKGKPVGLFEGAKWVARTMILVEGFQLMVFSDGVLETLTDDNLMTKESKLLANIKATVDRLAGQNAQKRLSLSDFAQGLGIDTIEDAPDDIAMVLIQQ